MRIIRPIWTWSSPFSAFDLYDRQWPVRTYHEQYPPIKVINALEANEEVVTGALVDSLIAGGCILEGARVERSVLSSNVRIEKRAAVYDSVIMEGACIGENAQIKNAILDKEVIVPRIPRSVMTWIWIAKGLMSRHREL